MTATLPFPRRRDWRWRWCQFADGTTTMHRVVDYERRSRSIVGLVGAVSACGVQATMAMPGFLSRSGARRCPRCCDAVGVKRGRGAPYNEGINA